MKNMKYYKMLALAAFVLMYAGYKKISQSVEKQACDKSFFAIVDSVVETDGVQTEIDLISEDKQAFVLYRRDIFRNKYSEFLPKYCVGDTVWLRYDKKTKMYDGIISYDSNRACVKHGGDFLIKNKGCCCKCR